MIETAAVVFLGVLMLTLLWRNFVNNSALRDCVHELKRIANVLERTPDAVPTGTVSALQRIADATERSAKLSDWRGS